MISEYLRLSSATDRKRDATMWLKTMSSAPRLHHSRYHALHQSIITSSTTLQQRDSIQKAQTIDKMASDQAIRIKPLEFLELVPNKQDKDVIAHTTLLILNQPINGIDFLKRVWSNSSWRVCADGGANQLYDLFTSWETTLRGAYVGRSGVS